MRDSEYLLVTKTAQIYTHEMQSLQRNSKLKEKKERKKEKRMNSF